MRILELGRPFNTSFVSAADEQFFSRRGQARATRTEMAPGSHILTPIPGRLHGPRMLRTGPGVRFAYLDALPCAAAQPADACATGCSSASRKCAQRTIARGSGAEGCAVAIKCHRY